MGYKGSRARNRFFLPVKRSLTTGEVPRNPFGVDWVVEVYLTQTDCKQRQVDLWYSFGPEACVGPLLRSEISSYCNVDRRRPRPYLGIVDPTPPGKARPLGYIGSVVVVIPARWEGDELPKPLDFFFEQKRDVA